MTIYAGIDVGNATTEIVLVERSNTELKLVGHVRGLTRGKKGSRSSLQGAASYVRRLERSLGVKADIGFVAPLQPVETRSLKVELPNIDTGRLEILARDVSTPGRAGKALGRPFLLTKNEPIDDRAINDPVIVIVPRSIGYREATKTIGTLTSSGIKVTGVVAEGDEGVLIANRIDEAIAVLDQIRIDGLEDAALIGMEVAGPGHSLSFLSDPLALFSQCGLRDSERDDATALASQLLDASNAVVVLHDVERTNEQNLGAWLEINGAHRDLIGGIEELMRSGVGGVTAISLDGNDAQVCEDAFGVDLADVARRAHIRLGSVESGSVVFSTLEQDPERLDHAAVLSELLGIPVTVAANEAQAARAGALTTPGARHDALVVDLGAGTIDVMTESSSDTAAGAGELLSACVAELLGVTRAAADWIKRGPSVRVEAPLRYETESAERAFFSDPAPADTLGRLACPGPIGLMGFDAPLSPSEWRALRLSLKERVIGANVNRVLASHPSANTHVIVVGGPAGDDELIAVLSRCLPDGAVVARANVGADFVEQGQPTLDHRYAAALGLVLLGLASEPQP